MKYFFLILFSVPFGLFAQQSELDAFVDNWHVAAAKADFDTYFGAMTDDFIFLGTAPGERWDKDAFAVFSRPYFDRGTAWDFKPSNRQWVTDRSKKIVWFDEDLSTWMEGCRGSGILVKEKGEWKLTYYNLTVLIENEKIEPFIDLRRQ